MSAFLDLPIEEHGIILRRMAPLETATNVPHLVTHHSPEGFEWGYGGSGPAELALNILEYLLRREGYTGETVRCFEGHCFRLAWHLHQDFKRDVIARCDRQEEHLSVESVQDWLDTYRLVAEPVRGPEPSSP